MLDKRCLCMLNVINAECVGAGYKIFSIEDLILAMPSRLGMDQAGVADCVKTLADREYISVKYQDEREICACPLTKGRLIFENKIDQELEKVRAEKRYFLYSFLGAFLGGILSLVAAIILSGIK